MQAHPSSAAAYADNGPSPIDRGYQLAYFFAYRLMRTYWRVRRPLTHGAVVAIWNAGEVLLVRNSYVSFYTAPGGYVRGGEGGVGAAVREIGEEVGMRVDPSQLKLALDVTHDWEFKHDHVQTSTWICPSARRSTSITARWWKPRGSRRKTRSN
jgi:ADP-ribose pyrophosphatase YjhB (NUDIX family)